MDTATSRISEHSGRVVSRTSAKAVGDVVRGFRDANIWEQVPSPGHSGGFCESKSGSILK